jgi:glutathione-specific gamma-glutamylcyclotransferase
LFFGELAVQPRPLKLTADLVQRAQRPVVDSGPEAGVTYLTEADYNQIADQLLAKHRPGEDIWLFAYGSLIWKPEVAHVEERLATAQGWRRSFCIRLERFRGTPEFPGLMMALDRGDECQGLALRLAGAAAAESIGKLVRRELDAKPPSQLPRWITVETDQGPVRAVAIVSIPEGRVHAGNLPIEVVAEILSKACGHWGSGAEYLRNTVTHLEQRGIHDDYLWRLQEMVADRIAAG